MTALSFRLPDGLAEQLRDCAAREGVAVDALLASAVAEKLDALLTIDRLRDRAERARPEDLTAFLESSPDAPPIPGDELG